MITFEGQPVVDGLKIDVAGEELRQWIDGRATYHRDRANEYAKQVINLRGLGNEAQNLSNDPSHNLIQKEREHRRKGEYFQFIADHIDVAAKYRLSDKDLTLVEIISNQW